MVMTSLVDSEYPVPIISAIIERDSPSGKEILVQTRIAGYDDMYRGTIEIPAGRIERFENIRDAIVREVKEETGLDAIEINPDIPRTELRTSKNDAAIVFTTYCCQQLLRGNIPWIGFVFLCKVKGKLQPAKGETKDPKWMNVNELKVIIENTPEKIFTLQLPVLDYYIKQQHE